MRSAHRSGRGAPDARPVRKRRSQPLRADLADDERADRPRPQHWSVPYIHRMLPELLTEAERDRLNLSVRPYSSASLIQLDDLPPEHAAELEAFSFMTLQTSTARAQAWISMPATGNPDDDRDFRRRVKKAARADPMASGSVRIAAAST
jgi:hypothetical protein